MNKIYEYQGFKIQNSPYGSEARWFIFDKKYGTNKVHFTM